MIPLTMQFYNNKILFNTKFLIIDLLSEIRNFFSFTKIRIRFIINHYELYVSVMIATIQKKIYSDLNTSNTHKNLTLFNIFFRVLNNTKQINILYAIVRNHKLIYHILIAYFIKYRQFSFSKRKNNRTANCGNQLNSIKLN